MSTILLVLLLSCGSSQEISPSSGVFNMDIDPVHLPAPTYENTMEEQLEQLEEEDVHIDLSVTVYSPTELMKPEEIEAQVFEISSEPVQNRMDHGQWNILLKKYVLANGFVNYKGFLSDWNELRTYIDQLGDNHPTEDWDRWDQMAYWINAYNALTIDLILRHYPVKSIKDIEQPWKKKLWKLGDKWYNLDEIEHQVLRKMGDPRIHFAIVCSSYSCPKLLNEAYEGSELDEQLSQVTRSFLADTTKNILGRDQVELSKIFQWFAKDFTEHGTLIEFLNQHSEVEISPNAKKRFKPYDWALNE